MNYEIKPLTPDEAELIEEKIGEYDDRVAPPVPGAEEKELVFKITDGGELVGGMISSADTWGSVEFQNLWIDERYRGKGLGSAIIREVERTAKEMGCYISIVSTWSYQARPLYEKHGYTLCSTVTDWPKGYDSYYLSKRLDVPAPGYAPSKPIPEYDVTRGDDNDAKFIHQKLHEYNCSKVPRLHGHEAFERKLVAADGNMVAGCAVDKDSLDIATLGAIWVDEAHRLSGLGSFLLGEVEREVKAAGGIFVVAYVFDWALGFFEKNGYVSCGAIGDFPKGHRMHAVKKVL